MTDDDAIDRWSKAAGPCFSLIGLTDEELRECLDAGTALAVELEKCRIELKQHRDALEGLAGWSNVGRTLERKPHAAPDEIVNWIESAVLSDIRRLEKRLAEALRQINDRRNQ